MCKMGKLILYTLVLMNSATFFCAAESTNPENKSSQQQTISRHISTTGSSGTQPKIRFQRRAVIPSVFVENPHTDNRKLKQLNPVSPHPQPRVILTRHEQLLINKAHRYFEQNWNQKTGLIDSVQGYSHTTMWDVASAIAGLLALEALEINNQQLSLFRLEKMLDTLLSLPLYKGILPNRQYNTQTAQASGSMSQTETNGNGWSALDLGRLYIWFEILKQNKPELTEKIDAIKQRWQLKRATKNGNLYGAKLTKNREYFRQEGRLGYLQYAATGFQLEGLNVNAAYSCKQLKSVDLNGVPLLIDNGNLPFFTLDPYLLHAIEIGYQESCWNQLYQIYRLHKHQAKTNNKLSAYAEDSLSKSPWFLYNNIIYQDQPWQSVSHSGKPISYSQTFSNKAAFAMSVLFNEPYGHQLAELVFSNSARHTVIPTGLYADGKTNTAYNINTNSLILVSLWYKSRNQRAILLPTKPDTLQANITTNTSLN